MAAAKGSGSFTRMFDEHLTVRPPLADRQIGEIPAKRGVLLLAAADGRPILLTTAASIRGRLRGRLDEPEDQQRKRSADLRAITRTIHWKLADGHFEMDWAYLEIARRIWPKTYARLLSWRPAWFVHVDTGDPFPHFARTRDVPAGPGQYLGPFDGGRSAERFIDAVQDAFDLCRDVQCLRRSPNGQRCAYGQMGRCLCPCDGTVPMDAYRRVVVEAAAFAAGCGREEHMLGLRERMKAASADLKFELAASLKARIDRLGELEGDSCRYVAPAEEFRFLLAQPGGSRRRVKVFLVDRGSIAMAKPLDWPLVGAQVGRTLRRMARFVAGNPVRVSDPADRWRIGRVARTLFSSGPRRGAVLRWNEALAEADLAESIEEAAGVLKLSARGKGADGGNSG